MLHLIRSTTMPQSAVYLPSIIAYVSHLTLSIFCVFQDGQYVFPHISISYYAPGSREGKSEKSPMPCCNGQLKAPLYRRPWTHSPAIRIIRDGVYRVSFHSSFTIHRSVLIMEFVCFRRNENFWCRQTVRISLALYVPCLPVTTRTGWLLLSGRGFS